MVATKNSNFHTYFNLGILACTLLTPKFKFSTNYMGTQACITMQHAFQSIQKGAVTFLYQNK